MKPEQALKILSRLKAAFPEANTPPETLEIYGEFLHDKSYEIVDKIVTKLIATAKFMPKISEILEACEISINSMKSAQEAYAEVNEAVARYGQYGVPKPQGGYDPIPWSSPVVADTVKTIGWINICQTPEDQDRTLFAQFRDTYNVFATRSREHAIVAPLLPAPEKPREITPATDNRKFIP